MKNGKRTFILTEIVLGLLVATLAFFMLYNKNEQKAEKGVGFQAADPLGWESGHPENRKQKTL